jgi:hypothetical protein
MEETPPWAEDRKFSGPIPLDSLLTTCPWEGEGGQIILPIFSWQFFQNEREYISMEFLQSLLQYLRENLLYNPILWGIAAVVLWIIGAAFIKVWRGKDEEEE